jgi:hypothetical protein
MSAPNDCILIRDHRSWALRAAIQLGGPVGLSASDRADPWLPTRSGT